MLTRPGLVDKFIQVSLSLLVFIPRLVSTYSWPCPIMHRAPFNISFTVSSSLPFASLSAVVLTAILLSCARWIKYRNHFPTPPSDFFFGHFRILNEGIPWITLTDYGKRYGKSHIHFTLLKLLSFFLEQVIYCNFLP